MYFEDMRALRAALIIYQTLRAMAAEDRSFACVRDLTMQCVAVRRDMANLRSV